MRDPPTVRASMLIAVGAHAIGIEAIEQAHARIAPHVHRTPTLRCRSIDRLAGRALFFKPECFQKGGAFKARGATNAIQKLTDEVASRGVVTHSSGNHAQAVAIAARARGIAAHIVMPSDAPRVKRRAVEGYGARIIECAPTLNAREQTAERVRRETGATLIAPYDHPDVMAGQGTVALELIEDVPELDAVVVPVGGGGLLSGVAIALSERAPKVAVYGAEPSGADDAARSKARGTRIVTHEPNTLADGLRTTLGELTWPPIRDLVRAIHVVDDMMIVAAMKLLFERAKWVVEPSGAIALAVALSKAFRRGPEHERVGVVLTGGNVDLDALPWAR